MPPPEAAPYGSWRSPITSDLIVRSMIRLDEIAIDGDNIYWSESRSDRQGRYFLVCRTPDGRISDVLPDDDQFNVRTRAHEYGGGAFLVKNGAVYFSNYRDQRMYRHAAGGKTEPQTPQSTPEGAIRYADGVLDDRRRRIICIQEDHTGKGEAVSRIVSIDASGSGEIRPLVAGDDFYSSPKLSSDESRLAWLTWHHPDMPWVAAELWVADFASDGSIGQSRKIAGGPDESIFQPEWSPEGTLYFVSDKESGWWNLYRHRESGIEAIAPMDAEFGRAQWVFGMSTYAFPTAAHIICTYTQNGVWNLARIDLESGAFDAIHTPYSEISQVRAKGDQAVFLGGSPSEPQSVVSLDLQTLKTEVLRRSTSSNEELQALAPYLSVAEPILFPTAEGRTAYGLYYKPCNADFVAPGGKREPLLVKAHGGPTSTASSTLSLPIQFWTSRGIAVLDVNYGGSTGYGREYRMRLEGNWGIVDVQDCTHGARYLVDRGAVDPERMAISGGSAGGYTVLQALTPENGLPTFHSGASYFGISDLDTFAGDTHKFESRYLDWLVGPYPDTRQTYIERSPLNNADRLTVPVIFFQGAEDEVVPPSQTERMVAALRARGVTVGYLLFAGEQHGFRKSENIKRALDAELYFYASVLLRCDLRF